MSVAPENVTKDPTPIPVQTPAPSKPDVEEIEPEHKELHRELGNASLAAALGASPPNDNRFPSAVLAAHGNGALAHLLVQRKPEDSVLPPTQTPPTTAPSPPITSTTPLIVEDISDTTSGQMRKTEFLTSLKTSVVNAAAEAFRGTRWSEAGCPYIERVFTYCSTLDSQRLERGIRRYAPETSSITTAAGLIPVITTRVQRSLTTWVRTGEVTGVPDEVPLSMLGAGLIGAVGGALSRAGSTASSLATGFVNTVSGLRNLFFKHENGNHEDTSDPQAVQEQLTQGHSLDTGVRTEMESVFGQSFSHVQVHTDPHALNLTKDMHARAFTVGHDIAFAPGQYQPGTLIGDALIAHELAHVTQQSEGVAGKGFLYESDGEYGHLEEDADELAVGAVVSTWGSKVGLPKLTQQTLPALKSGLRLQRCDDGPQYAHDRTVPAPSQVAPGFADRVPGEHEFPRYDAGTRSTAFKFDGDGDQQRELIGRLRVLRSARLDYPTLVELEIEQVSSHTIRTNQFTISDDINNGGGYFQPRLNSMTDGHDPTRIQITDWGGKGTTAQFFPPTRSAQGVSYRCEVAGQILTYDFPNERTPLFEVFQSAAEGARQAGTVWSLDVNIGAYRDPFRLTFAREGSSENVIFGMSAMSPDGPVGGKRADLHVSGTLSVRILRGDPVSLALDLNGDGQSDLEINDQLRAEPDYSSSFQQPQPGRFRRHFVTLHGPAANNQSFTWEVRDGRLIAGSSMAEASQFPAASQAAAATSLPAQSTIGVPALTLPSEMGTLTGELDAIENLLGQARLQARQAELISQRVFDAWDVLHRDMVLASAQVESHRPAVDPQLQRETAQHAQAFYDALRIEASSATVTWGSKAGGGTKNEYTGLNTSQHLRPSEQLVAAINSGQWPEAFRRYRALVNGLDRWIEHMYRERRESLPADGPPTDLARSAGVLSNLQLRLEDVRSHAPTRVAAVFHPEEQYTSSGVVTQVPLSLYYWREENTWHLQDLTSEDAPHETQSVRENELEPPPDMFHDLAESSHYPRGIIYYRLPSGTAGRLTPTGPGAWREWLTWIGIGLAAVGLGLATFGTGTVAVIGAVALGASAAIGGGMAAVDLIERGMHGNLTAGQAVLDVAQIIAAIAGIGAMRAGRIISVARAAAAEGAAVEGQAALTVMRAQSFVFPLTATALGADVVTLAVLTPQAIEQYTALDGIDDPNARRRARILLIGQMALTAGLTALSIRGNVAEMTAGRNIRIEYIPGPGGPVPVAIPEGLSAAGRAVTETRQAVTAAVDETATRLAQEAHLQKIRSEIGGQAGEALAKIEELALQARTQHARTFPMIADGAGRITRANQPAGSLHELVESLDRANNAARAHGLDVEYTLRFEPGPTPGTTTVRVESDRRAPGTGVNTAGLHTDVPPRAQAEFAEVQRLRNLDNQSTVALTSEGQLQINGQVTMHPSVAGRMTAEELRDLMRLTRELQSRGGTTAAFRGMSGPDKARLGELRSRYNFRFGFQQQEAVELLATLGLQNHPLFQNLTEAQLSRLHQGLVGESLPGVRYRTGAAPAAGRPPDLQSQGASWAISRNPATVEEFVNLFQFYVANFRRVRATRIARRDTRVEELFQQWRRSNPASDATAQQSERSRIENRVSREPGMGTDAEIGGDILGELGEPGNLATAGPHARTDVGAAYERATQFWRDRLGAVRLRLGASERVNNLSAEEIARRVQELADQISFRDLSTATYHTEKHFGEILPAGSPLDAPVDAAAYLAASRQAIRSPAIPLTEIAAQSGSYIYGGSRSFTFETRLPNGNNMGAIVAVTDTGEVFLLTFFKH